MSNTWYALDITGYCVAEFLSRDYDPHELVDRHGKVTVWDRSDGDRLIETLPNTDNATTTNERLVRELQEAGHDPDFIAEAEEQMLDAMDELGCS